MELVCIRCPQGCTLAAALRDGVPAVSGNRCPLGAAYAVEELLSPTRLFASTVPLTGRVERLPVAVSRPVALGCIMDLMAAIRTIEAAPPVARGQIIAANLCASGADLVATRSIR